MYHSSISSSSCCCCYGKSDGPFLVPGAAAPFVGSGAFRPSESLPSASSCLLLSRHNLQLLHRSSPHLLQHQQKQPCYGAHLGSQSGMAVAPSRRVPSTGDLVEEHPRAVAGRYSAGERRERIEKYRSKRNRRNFGKKITYACRKTLADSRKRVKGRFACNADADADVGAHLHLQADQAELTQTEASTLMDDANVNNVDGSSGTRAAVPEWWPAMQEALAREEEAEVELSAAISLHLCDDQHQEMLAAYLGVNL